jgi:hypothetical protein|tara:strand:- start:1238 stop:1591 length:354 start_codon:yes stop_codon:yes gene_type:complete
MKRDKKTEYTKWINKIKNNKESIASYISERMGGDLPQKKLLRYKVVDKYLFFKCEEQYLYGWWFDDYIGNNPTMIFVLPLVRDDYSHILCPELYDDISPKGFSWNKKDIQNIIKDYS